MPFIPWKENLSLRARGGMVFEGEDVDLSDDWADYDGDNDISISVTDFESKFDVA